MVEKVLDYKEIKSMYDNNKTTQESATEYWRAVVLGYIANVMEVGERKYKITDRDIDMMTDIIANNDTMWEIVDENIAYELQEFEISKGDE